jgi:hypothetical protein
MYAISRMLSRANGGGFLSGFQVDNRNNSPLEISHLLSVDDIVTDTLIMCDADVDQIHLCFEAILGLKVKLKKSELVAVGEVAYIEGLTNIVGVISLLFHCITWVFLLVLLLGSSFWYSLQI